MSIRQKRAAKSASDAPTAGVLLNREGVPAAVDARQRKKIDRMEQAVRIGSTVRTASIVIKVFDTVAVF